MKFILFSIFTIFYLKLFATSYSNEDRIWDCSKYQTGQVVNYIDKNLSRNVSYDYLKYVTPRLVLKGQDEKKRLVDIDYVEYKLHPDINCQYIVEVDKPNLSVDSDYNKYFASMTYIFANLCVNLNGQISFIKIPNVSSADHENLYRQVSYDDKGQVKWPVETINNLGYIWQNSRCENTAVDIFKQLNNDIKLNQLLENNYLKIKQHSDFMLFYANPGIVVKTNNPFNCKWNSKCELKVKYKKQLEFSIFDSNGKLHTNEDLEDRSDCELKHFSTQDIKIEDRIKYFVCHFGLDF